MTPAEPPGLVAALNRKHGALRVAFNVALAPRGVTALFGPSGAGKTSCLRIIAGLDRSAVGRLSFGDEIWQDSRQRIFAPPHRRRVGYVAQTPSLFTHHDVLGNLDFAWRRAGRPAHLNRDELIDLTGLRALLPRRVEALSGGERQRVAIARALLSDPALLLLDEPLSALDGVAREDLLRLLETLHAGLAAPMIYVSHAIDEVARLADHIVLLEAGQVVAQGPLNAIVTRLDLPPALIEASGAVIEGVVTAHDTIDQLAELSFDGGVLLLPLGRGAVGDRLRCRIGARDVVLTCERQAGSSALNQLACRVVAIGDADHRSQCLVQLDASGTILVARITRRSLRGLELRPGRKVWAQVKAVALGGYPPP
jgi:molybdate transport system ATP-binding protein